MQGKVKAGLVFGLIVIVAVGSFMAYRAVKRAIGSHAAVAPSATTPSENNQTASLPIAVPPIVITGDVMAHAFRSGQLPAPLPQPQGTPEQAAA